MKRFLKIVGIIAAVLVTVVVVLMVVLMSPSVQTALTRKVLSSLEDKLDGRIEFSSITVRPFDAVVIEDFALIDNNPYSDPEVPWIAPADTVITAKNVSLVFSIAGLLSGEAAVIKDLRVKDGSFSLVNEPGGNNLKRIFSKNKLQKEKKELVLPEGEIFRANYLSIEGFRFRMKNFRRPKLQRPGGMNFTDLDLYDINVTARKVSMSGSQMKVNAVIEHLEGVEKSGYILNHMHGKVEVTTTQTWIRNVVLRDVWSDIKLSDFKMIYPDGLESLKHFIEEVTLEGSFQKSRLNFESIAYFAPTLHRMDQVMNIYAGNVSGTVSDLRVWGLRTNTPDGSFSGEVDGSITGLPRIYNTQTNYDLKNARFTTEGLDKFIKGFAPNVKFDFAQFGKEDTFTFNGTIRGLLNSARITGTLEGDHGGSVSTNLTFANLIDPAKTLSISGNMKTNELNAGIISGNKSFGPCTMHGSFSTKLRKGDVSVKIDSLRIDKLNAFDYDYHGFMAAGTYSEEAFNGLIFCNDPNLSFMFKGLFSLSGKTGSRAYKFNANLVYANLNAIHIDKRGKSELSLLVDANFKTLADGDILGNIKINDIVLVNEKGPNDIGGIEIDSYMKDNVNKINFDSRFARIRYSGSAFLGSFIKDLSAITVGDNLPSLLKGKPISWSGNNYTLDFKAGDAITLLDYIVPGLWVEDGSSLSLGIDRSGQINGKLQSRRLALGDNYLKNADVSLNNVSGPLEGFIYADEFKLSALRTLQNRINIVAENDNIGLIYSYDNDADGSNKGTISIGGQVIRDDADLSMRAYLLPSQIIMNSAKWKFSSTPLSISKEGMRLSQLLAYCQDQSMEISGGISRVVADTLRFNMNNFNLKALTPFLPLNLEAGGNATGIVMLLSPLESTPTVLSNLTVTDAELGGEKLGLLKMGSMWDEGLKAYKAIVRSTAPDGTRTLDFWGSLSPNSSNVNATLELNNFAMGCVSPIVTSVFSDFDGSLSGKITAKGPLKKGIIINSQDLKVTDGLIRPVFNNVPYKMEGLLTVNNDGAFLQDVIVEDQFGAKGSATGGVRWKSFRDIKIDVGLDIKKMQVLNLEEDMNPAFYGKIKATGNASLQGTINNLIIKANAYTVGSGELHIPMNNSGGMARADLLVFKEAPAEQEPDRYEVIRQSRKSKEKRATRVEIEASLAPHDGITGYLEIDKTAGNMLSTNGSGNINIKVIPSEGKLDFTGNYNINSGIYHFAALGIAKRDFTIQDGSNVKFGGNIMDSDLDIRALYTTKTTLSTLLSDTTSNNTRRLVECGINISEKIRAPKIQFTIDIPNIDPTTRARVESALNTEDKLQKQFLSLLISGGFIPDEPSGIVNNSGMLGATMADMMASQLSSVLQKLDIPIDLGLAYQQSTSGADIFEVAVSTQLFNNRISINGTFGNRQTSATAREDVVGDIDVELKLTRNGNIRATAFHHSADQYTNYLDNLKRSGLGLSFQTEFDTIKELFRNLLPLAFKSSDSNSEAIVEEKEKTVIIIEADD